MTEPLRHVELADVLEKLEESGRPFDRELVEKAHQLAAEVHEGQTRLSGEPYLDHPTAVAYLLADLKFDETCVVVGLLHDVLEDTEISDKLLEERFGKEIASLVDGVTKIGRHPYVRRDEAQAGTYRKLILATARDMRVILVKLADRLHNMMTLGYLPAEARRRIARETLEIYAPIAHRLGMARVQGDLEDLAFYHLYPHQYADLKQKVEEKTEIGRASIEAIRDRLAESLADAGIEAEISFRVKRFYSIYRKLHRQGIDISQLYDYLAFRVIAPEVQDCYGALGVVHQNWRPIPGRFKDYIAMPKPNLYQSVHTTVVAEKGQPFEVQFRTREMDLVAEEGIAAHWRFKEGSTEAQAGDPNILWLRQLLDWQKEVRDSRTFLANLKIDLYPDEVYVFTPKGDVFALPRGATALDFAYKVHTELGHRCVGARVNGKQVRIRTELHNGDIAEVLTDPSRKPSRDWLNFVVTSRAKSKIRNWLNAEQKKRAIEIGRRLFEKESRRFKVAVKKVLEMPELAQYLSDEGIANVDELLSRIGFGRITVKQVLRRVLTPEQLKKEGEAPGKLQQVVNKILPFHGESIKVKGQDDMMAYLARCCDPLPGEKIVGYITRGRGVSVHSEDCPNVKRLLYNPEREIEVEWGRAGDDKYPVVLTIETEDEPGMLARLTELIAKLDGNIRHIEADTEETGTGLIEVVISVKNRRHLERLRSGIGALRGVRLVHRRVGGRNKADPTS